ncbi:MAG: TldD/PmbA family protein [Pseudomonadota bacterium]
MKSQDSSNHLDIAGRALDFAMQAGADAADVVVVGGHALSARVRLGALEGVERSEDRDLGLRVFSGKSHAIVATCELDDASLRKSADLCLEMAKVAPEDPFDGLAESVGSGGPAESLDLFDSTSPSAADLEADAQAAEAAALEVSGVTNSNGASAGHQVSTILLATSNGFSGSYSRSSFSRSCGVLAGEGTAMESDYDYSMKVHREDLDAPDKIGRTAGERAVRRLGGRKMPTQQVPVVYHPRVASQLVSNFAGAISGSSISRGASFLKDRLGDQVFAKAISIIDDPRLCRGHRSRPFDAEGLTGEMMRLIEEGSLTSWILDSRTARQLGLESNGRASRGHSSGPAPSATNLYMAAGEVSPEDLIADIKAGFLVMGLMGRGGSVVTGDYSEGANGYWIENGEIAHPVSEVTIASNLKDMFLNMSPANDLEFRGAVNAPTLRVEGMTVAGS